ncbi:DnaJ domain-containing protein [Sessilibacter sp. MAH1]
MIRSLLVIIALIVIFTGVKYINRQPPEKKRQLWIKVTLYTVAAVMIGLALTGRIHWLGAALAALLPIGRSLLVLAPKVFPFIQPWLANKIKNNNKNARSTNTSILQFVLSDNGEMAALVISGPFSGKALADLTDEQLIELLTFCKSDADSHALIIAYLNKYKPYLVQSRAPKIDDNMSISEAQDVLGLKGQYQKQDVIEAHRKLMQKFHPDRGGSDYLAAKINSAKEILLRNLER